MLAFLPFASAALDTPARRAGLRCMAGECRAADGVARDP